MKLHSQFANLFNQFFTTSNFNSRQACRLWLLPIFAAVTALVCLGAGNWKSQLKDNLTTAYPLTKVGIKGLQFDYNRISAPGGVFVVRISGIYADLAGTEQAIIKSTIRNGQVEHQAGILSAFANTSQAKTLKVGDTVYVLGISVKDNGVQFELLTTDPVDFDGLQTRYRSVIFFPFEKGSLAGMKFDDVKKTIDTGFTTPQAAQAGDTKTIKIGMSPDEVTKTLGAPQKIVDLGTKKIYVYKDMKVIFKDARVADVE